MDRILHYIIRMLPYMIIAIPIILLIRYFIYYRKTNRKINLVHEITLFIFFIFIFGLASQTIIPKTSILPSVLENFSKVNLIPFKIVFDTYIEVFKNNNINYFIISFLGNIVMFIPIGFFPSLLWNLDTKKVILVGFLSSLFIEVSQLFIGRTTDIDDLILNTLGTIMGILLYKLLTTRITNKFKKN